MSQSQTENIEHSGVLSSLKPGGRARVAGYVDGCDASCKMKLLSLGLTKGTEVREIKTAPLGDPIEIELRGYRLSLRKAEAETVILEAL